MVATQVTSTGAFIDQQANPINANFLNAFPSPPIVQTGDFTINPAVNGFYVPTKGSAAAITLGAPAQDGIIVTISSGSDQLHVLTATGLLRTGGTATGVLTAVAHAGATVVLVSWNAKWQVVSNVHWTETS